jgi:hypothetical protein
VHSGVKSVVYDRGLNLVPLTLRVRLSWVGEPFALPLDIRLDQGIDYTASAYRGAHIESGHIPRLHEIVLEFWRVQGGRGIPTPTWGGDQLAHLGGDRRLPLVPCTPDGHLVRLFGVVLHD